MGVNKRSDANGGSNVIPNDVSKQSAQLEKTVEGGKY